MFVDPVDCLEVSSGDSLAAALAQIERDGLWTVAVLDYELAGLLEPAVAECLPLLPGRPLARFWRYRACRKLTAGEAEDWLACDGDPGPAGVGGLHPDIGAESHAAGVERIRGLIADGDCYQVNYTFPYRFSWHGRPRDLYRRLRAQQPVRYGGFVGDERGGLVSLSPELFLERQGDRLLARPMKGTLARDRPPEELSNSAKDRAENLMIVDLLRNDLGRIAANGSVRVERLFSIESYPTLWQMVSEISAVAREHGLAKTLAALFPCGSITGAPKIRAMQIAAELEGRVRGSYTGAMGWIAPNGDLRLNVAIRTLELDPGGRGRFGVGSGIVIDSQAAPEWQECLLKAAFLTRVDPGLCLIETLRRENGEYPRLAGHLERLSRSAAWFAFPFDEDHIRRALAAQPAAGLWRVRLTLAADGGIAVAATPFSENQSSWSFARLAETAIDSDDPLRGHKTTVRDLYDRTLASIAGDPATFDAVFLNQRGEVAEGARSNVFVERDGILLTPPVESGALPGVLRAELLAAGHAREAVLTLPDLAEGFCLGNALRGLVPVTLSPTGNQPRKRVDRSGN